jgi:folate-binding protein YgfZ
MQADIPRNRSDQLEGGTPGLFRGHSVVLDYGDWIAEYVALKRSAGVVCLGHIPQIEIAGPDRATFLNRLCTNKIDGLGPGEGRETFLTDAKGHVLAHAAVLTRSESLCLRAVGSEAGKIIAHLDFYLVRDNVTLCDRSGEWLELLLAGPDAIRLLGQLTSTEIPQSRLAHRDVELVGQPVSVRCLQTGSAPIFVLSLPDNRAADAWHALRKAGAAACGHQALETLRIEAGWPIYGQDIGPANLPQEVGRDAQAISFTKGCYLGQETVARLDSRGHVNKVLVGLKFAAAEVPARGDELANAGQRVGEVTSAGFSPDFGAAIGLGYVRRGFEQPGTQLDGLQGLATVVAVPMK